LSLLALWLTTGGPALAAPLDQGACESLKIEYDKLIAGGTKTDMQQGPDWAKANLSVERLGQISRFIDLEEQLSFRCPQPKVVKEQPDAPAGSKKKGGKKEAAAQTDEPDTPAAETPPKPTTKKAAAKPDAPAKPATKPKKAAVKANASDAYTPPPAKPSDAYVPSPKPAGAE
jgi:hypothetical protein